MGIRKFELYLKQRGCELVDEDARYVRFVNKLTGRDAIFMKARMINYETVILVCNDLGVSIPLQVSARRRGVRGARRVIRRKFRV